MPTRSISTTKSAPTPADDEKAELKRAEAERLEAEKADEREPVDVTFTGPSRGLHVGDWFVAETNPYSNYGDDDHGIWQTTDPDLADRFRDIAEIYGWTEVPADPLND